jgi:hypothetical protein
VSDPDCQPETAGELADGGRAPRRRQPSGIGHDAHTALVSKPETALQLPNERGRVPFVGVFRPRPEQDQHGELGEVVAGEHVKLAAVEHLSHRREPVAVKARAVADAHCALRRGVGVHNSTI